MPSEIHATALVRDALAGTGIELVASCGAQAYDRRAPASLRSGALVPGARGVVVAASAGPGLWRRFLAATEASPERWDAPHPYDAFVAETLDRADSALRAASISFARFEAAFHAPVRVDFVALGELVGLGTRGPFNLLIHPVHGPWWALRGAWIVAAEVEPAAAAGAPCATCAAPCVGGREGAGGAAVMATPEVRSRCVVGQSSRYDEDQIAFHYDRLATVARLRERASSKER
jgi:hypothetical protein